MTFLRVRPLERRFRKGESSDLQPGEDKRPRRTFEEILKMIGKHPSKPMSLGFPPSPLWETSKRSVDYGKDG